MNMHERRVFDFWTRRRVRKLLATNQHVNGLLDRSGEIEREGERVRKG